MFKHGHKLSLQAGHKLNFKHGHKLVHGTERNGLTKKLLTLIAYLALRIVREETAKYA